MKTKTKQAMAAMGLTAVLALGAAPAALAADGAIDNGTTIKVKTTVERIDVTVPLELEVVGPVSGGGLTTVPDATAYKVTNNSNVAVKVASVKGVAQEGWNIVTEPPASGAAPTGAKGDICLKIAKGDETATSNVKTITTDAITLDWAVPAKTADPAAPGTLGIMITKDGDFSTEGYKGSAIAVAENFDAGVSAVKVEYTVSV